MYKMSEPGVFGINKEAQSCGYISTVDFVVVVEKLFPWEFYIPLP